MKDATRFWKLILTITILLLLIFDTDTATQGAYDGLELCMKVIIPSLFPFFIVTSYLNASLLGHSVPGFHRLSKLLNIPDGGDSLLLLGLIGGYPVGAQLVAQAYREGHIQKRTCNILLGYCSNAGPAFIFGITGALFSSKLISFALWGIHILSAIVTGYLLPRPEAEKICWNHHPEISIVQALKRSINICTYTCGWIIVFKIILAYLDSWFPAPQADAMQVLLSGILELSNGCIRLSQITSVSLRFILCSLFLSFGGICVLLQTISATDELGLGLYIPGKIAQTAISIVASTLISNVLFPNQKISFFSSICIFLLCASVLFFVIKGTKKDMVFLRKIQYNEST